MNVSYKAILIRKLYGGFVHTYVIGRYNPSVRFIDLVSHTTYIVCVLILYISGGTYSLKLTPNDRCFEKLFMEEIADKIIFVFCFMSGLGLEAWLYV